MMDTQPHARVWRMIFHTLDSAGQTLECMDNLSWMPSHTSRRSIGRSDKSDGTAVSSQDWRANRLVDAAARQCAVAHRPSCKIRTELANYQRAYYAGLLALATVTDASNFHSVRAVDENGNVVSRTIRDSTATNKMRRRRRKFELSSVKTSMSCRVGFT